MKNNFPEEKTNQIQLGTINNEIFLEKFKEGDINSN